MKKPKNLWQLKKKIAKLEAELKRQNANCGFYAQKQQYFVEKYNELTKTRFEQKVKKLTETGLWAGEKPEKPTLGNSSIVGQQTTFGEKDVAKFIQNLMDSQNEKD